MSYHYNRYIRVKWGRITVIPWYRQLLALIFGMGVMAIALLAIVEGSSMWVIGGVAGMAFLTLLLIFGVEVDYLEIGRLHIEFTGTTRNDDDE